MKSIRLCPLRSLIYEKYELPFFASQKNPILHEVEIALAYFSPIFYSQVHSDE